MTCTCPKVDNIPTVSSVNGRHLADVTQGRLHNPRCPEHGKFAKKEEKTLNERWFERSIPKPQEGNE